MERMQVAHADKFHSNGTCCVCVRNWFYCCGAKIIITIIFIFNKNPDPMMMNNSIIRVCVYKHTNQLNQSCEMLLFSNLQMNE